MTYFARLTTGGAALVAAATAGTPLVLQNVVVGDANGTPYTPTGSETALHHQVASVLIDSLSVDGSGNLVVVATFPAATGGYTAREVGILDNAGHLIAIASMPATDKPDPSSGAGVDMVITLRMAFSGSPTVVVIVDSSAIYLTADGVRALMHFFAVKSATVVAEPGSPTAGDYYLVPPSATGTHWAGQDNKVAYYRNSTDGWQFISPPAAARVNAADTKTDYRHLVGGTWEIIVASTIDLFVWSRQGAGT